MRKYLYTFKTSFIESFTYIPSILFKFISYFISMFIMFSLWRYIYDDPSKVINNFTLVQMMWYLLLSEVLTYGHGRIANTEIIESVKSGSIAYNLNKPYNYILYVLTRHIADGVIRVILYTIVSFIIGILFVGGMPDFNIMYIPFMLITFVMGYIINALIKILISLISFWIEDATPFFWIYNKILLIFGVFFPIDMFPVFLQPILKLTPVYVSLYGPVMLIIDFSFKLFLKVLLVQIIYLLIVVLLITIIYRKGMKKVNVNGG